MKSCKSAAFTMIELVFVIVVLGILAAMAMPRLERDLRQEAADNILFAIRHTQHLALMDNVRETNATWQRAFWRFGFNSCSDDGIFYYIAADKDLGGGVIPSANEAAIDPLNGQNLAGQNTQPCETDISGHTTASSNIFITRNHSISDGNVAWSGGCVGTSNYIGFDNLGRPHRGFLASSAPDYATVVTSDCNLTLTFDTSDIEPLIITIEKETGHAYIAGQPDS